jgi:hypothetical protein
MTNPTHLLLLLLLLQIDNVNQMENLKTQQRQESDTWEHYVQIVFFFANIVNPS